LIETADYISENGIFSVIIPFKEEEKFLGFSRSIRVISLKITHVKGKPTTEIKIRSIAFT
jgi:tRNA1Val (adenine37-N6)-methyltransferase